ncbi:uncharacterized protein [Antedon mediterranea]|uniref:uncharacterized protein n=1 Tax=Antedon mediterranea TaxID=105859 RepID=UPI003AF7079D
MPGLQDGKYRKYSQEVVRIACGRVRKGELSYGAAARMYGIPKSTIRDKVSGRTPIESTPGPDPILSKKEEEQLVGWAIGMAKIGYGRTMMEMKRVVKKFLDANGRPNPFVDNLPGRRWMRNFLRRHPELSMRLPETLGRERADVTVNKIQRWFRECSDYMVESKNEEVFADPRRLFKFLMQTKSASLSKGRPRGSLHPRGKRMSTNKRHPPGNRSRSWVHVMQQENDIILYCLPSHASHIIQPLDVAVYKSVKASWYNCVREYTIQHPGQVVTKQAFSSVFAESSTWYTQEGNTNKKRTQIRSCEARNDD